MTQSIKSLNNQTQKEEQINNSLNNISTKKRSRNNRQKSIIDDIRERHPVPNPWRVGEVAQIIVKVNPDLKGRNGQWCIVEEVLNFSCLVRTWDGLIQVKIENLKDFYYSSQQQQEMKKISNRLSKIPLKNLEESVKKFLEELGKIERPFLTAREEEILRLIETQI